MTGYTVHTGSNEKFSEGWDQVFRAKSALKTTRVGKSAPEQAPAKRSPQTKSVPAQNKTSRKKSSR